ncbi:hypothetical protein HH212_18280 [Massilia forsythiae]|uniref:ABC-type transport auxiliary lipoprotein component domain-containing protein n=1 Tax=Massilia forsythiae TaxID=2728020 RepID=A0A7Z2VYQ6_9BURK|nr:ABC-type transport auxiliary lipoprotein family protein [Massilia forsythiae]QJE01731.1 hypothetical protein HH212_18280 [Massilia forsythiae]
MNGFTTPSPRAARRLPALGALFALASVLSGCASTPPATLLSLPSAVPLIASAAPPRSMDAAMPVLAVGRLDIPEYLVARRVRYKVDDSTVAEWPDTYWAERIEVGASREFTAALQQRLPGWRVCDADCTPLHPRASLRVDLVRMDYVRGQRKLVGKVRFGVLGRTPDAGSAAANAAAAVNAARGEERVYEVAASGDSPQAQAQAVTELLRRIAADAAALVGAVS